MLRFVKVHTVLYRKVSSQEKSVKSTREACTRLFVINNCDAALFDLFFLRRHGFSSITKQNCRKGDNPTIRENRNDSEK